MQKQERVHFLWATREALANVILSSVVPGNGENEMALLHVDTVGEPPTSYMAKAAK